MKWTRLIINVLVSGLTAGLASNQIGVDVVGSILAGVAAAASNAAGLFQRQPQK